MKVIAIYVAAALVQQAPEPISNANSPLNDYSLSFNAAGTLMVFARSEGDFKNAQIFIAERKGRSWSSPKPIGFSDHRYADSDPWLTPDGATLYFISDRPSADREGGRNDYDIWRSSRTSEGWSAPEHLGREANSRGQELGPELHDGILYFSSARRSGMGGLDIYRAAARDRTFETASLLDGPFNTTASDSDFTLSADGRSAMFWRSVGAGGTLHISYRGVSGWSSPVPLPATINSGPFNFTPSFSRDTLKVHYASTVRRAGQAEGLADIYEAKLPSR